MYGQSLHVWDWKERQRIQTLDLGAEGLMPLEIRFLHDPAARTGFVGCALTANVFRYSIIRRSNFCPLKKNIDRTKERLTWLFYFRFHQADDGKWQADKVIDVPSWKVSGWALPEMPGIITDILISLDDRYLYLSNWVQGKNKQRLGREERASYSIIRLRSHNVVVVRVI